ncbi:unnamed protein product [Vitrella brassicaformis CCMP3155]|uniref:monogalactosyldiacylglycerol synthase n=3 Tax=Vitrella brassicaformis TaxID=1169539 RepID=A0A0G4FJV7_VITBC|nr:unnamed protein product [Vitrella brassicaformis CCMP3155]|eukprot:CEM14063.1 unnamed protein product [Vitrella brassicaformis CCMP3155]
MLVGLLISALSSFTAIHPASSSELSCHRHAVTEFHRFIHLSPLRRRPLRSTREATDDVLHPARNTAFLARPRIHQVASHLLPSSRRARRRQSSTREQRKACLCRNTRRDPAACEDGQDRRRLTRTSASKGGSAAVAEPPAVPREATGGKKDVKRVLIVMSDTGGGHKASALALKDALWENYNDNVDVRIVDIWTDYGVFPFNTFVPSYRFMSTYPITWKLFYEWTKWPSTIMGGEVVGHALCGSRFRQLIESYNPDLIVSVHPLCQHVMLRVLQDIRQMRNRNIPFVTVVTDLGGAHPSWFHPGVDLCFVPSQPVREIALQEGIKPDQMRQYGLPIRRGFWQQEKRPKGEIRDKLGLTKGVPTCLVVGGGEGVGGLDKVVDALVACLGTKPFDSEVVAICGKNGALRRRLERKYCDDAANANNGYPRMRPRNVSVKPHGFVTNMEDFMAAADCIVTKAGPGTIAESAIRGLPIMLSSYLPGQEEPNVPYVIDRGFGDYSSVPSQIARRVASWLEDPKKLQDMSGKAVASSRPSATIDIATELGEILALNKRERKRQS